MNTLMTINQTSIGEASVQTVNARELHAFLEVGKDFSNWIKARIEKYGFLENQDFVVFAKTGENPEGGRPTIDYHLTLDMAKELSMVERNDKGKQARQYFIECERRAKQAPPVLDPRNLSRMQLMQIAMDAERERLELEHKIEEQAPKVQGFDRIANAAGLLTLRETATTLKIPERQFIQWMQQHDWLYRRPGKGTLLGYAGRIKQGFLEHKAVTIHNMVTGTDEVREHVRVTPRGLSVLAQRFGEVGNG